MAFRSKRPKAVMNQKSMCSLLEHHGWVREVGGKHQIKMTKPGHRPVTLPQNKGRDYPKGLRGAILQQAGIEDGRKGMAR